jgi:hypothetical protein
LHCIEQAAIKDRRLLSEEDLSLVIDLSNVEAVAQEIGEGPAGERNAADGPAGGQRADPGGNARCPQIGKQRVENPQFQVSTEDMPDSEACWASSELTRPASVETRV